MRVLWVIPALTQKQGVYFDHAHTAMIITLTNDSFLRFSGQHSECILACSLDIPHPWTVEGHSILNMLKMCYGKKCIAL